MHDTNQFIKGDIVDRNQINDSIPEKQQLKESEFFNKFLKNLDEPDLKNLKKEAYRFFLSQSFDSCEVLFRIEKDSANNVDLTTKYFLQQSPDGNGRDTVLKVINKKLTLKDWNEIESRIYESYFWTLEETDNPRREMFDGSEWTIEGIRIPTKDIKALKLQFKNYTYVYRRSPYHGSFHDLGIAIAKMSNSSYEKTIY